MSAQRSRDRDFSCKTGFASIPAALSRAAAVLLILFLALLHDAAGRTVEVTDPLSRTWEYRWDAAGRLRARLGPVNADALRRGAEILKGASYTGF
jgi:YD repeat-containing protein